LAEPTSLKAHSPLQTQRKWPLLKVNTFIYTSLETGDYNCVSWALGLTDVDRGFIYTDDGDAEPDQNIDRYINYFRDFGFVVCESSEFEKDFEKIALYANELSQFLHVARQLEDGTWTSKLGEYEDINHFNLDALSGPFYGSPFIYMKR